MFQLNLFPFLCQSCSKTVSFLFIQNVWPVLGAAGILGSFSKSTEVAGCLSTPPLPLKGIRLIPLLVSRNLEIK